VSFAGTRSFQFPPKSFGTDWYRSLFTDPLWSGALWNSFKVGAVVAIVATVIATATALALTRGKVPGRGMVKGLILFPMIVPVIVIAVGVFTVALDLQLAGSTFAIVLAHLPLALPPAVVVILAGLEQQDENLEKAALGLGASRWTAIRTVTVPLMGSSVLAGGLFAFLSSFDEAVISSYLSSPTVTTLPAKMFSTFAGPTAQQDPTVAAAASVLTVMALVSFAGAAFVAHRLRISRRRARSIGTSDA
jgi:putative spermidine/putrescine transport system permease protein